ncbi:MAG: hypothetical protein ABIH46_03115 [Chloroflexota bacterium]
MAFVHGLDADFYFTGTNIAQYLTEIEPSFERELAEMGHLGESWKSSLAGLRMGSFSVSGDYDNTLDDLVWAAFDASTSTVCVFYPEGTGAGDKFDFRAWVSSFTPGSASASDVAKYSFDLTITGTVTRSAGT